MSLRKNKQNDLWHRHAAAHATSQNVSSLFHNLADELDDAANQHNLVADEAHEQAVALNALVHSAEAAGYQAQAQAAKIRALVS